MAHDVGLRHRTITVAIEGRPDQVPPGQEYSFIKRDLARVSRCRAHRQRAIRSYKGTISLCAPLWHPRQDRTRSGTGYANPHAVTQIANGQSTTTYSYDKSRGRMHYATGTRLRIASPVLRSPRLTLKRGA